MLHSFNFSILKRKLFPTALTKLFSLAISIIKAVRKMHHTSWILAVTQSKGMTKLVNSFLNSPLTIKFFIFRQAIKFLP